MALTRGVYGEVTGFPPGTLFRNREELYETRVHRQLQAGIAGSATAGGAESIVLNGGYEDDEDEGAWIIYTGQGGNDPSTRRQIQDQELTRGNLALTVNALEGVPVRVIRGERHRSRYSPPTGYRYDGLYYVDRHWHDRGRSGFKIYRYLLRTADALAPIYSLSQDLSGGVADRKVVEIQRIVRNTVMATGVKRIHDYSCQVCDTRLVTASGPYAEGAHIRPLGRPHDGPDVAANILCMCANHHILFDRGAFAVATDLTLIGIHGRLRMNQRHRVGTEFLEYHREHYLELRRPAKG